MIRRSGKEELPCCNEKVKVNVWDMVTCSRCFKQWRWIYSDKKKEMIFVETNRKSSKKYKWISEGR